MSDASKPILLDRLRHCVFCRFWTPGEAFANSGKPPVADCRRHAPQIAGDYHGFPRTNAEQWCGDWEMGVEGPSVEVRYWSRDTGKMVTVQVERP